MTQDAESANAVNCPDVESLSAWFDGEDATVSGEHVEECGVCSDKVKAYTHIQRELSRAAIPTAGLSARIKAACVQERESRRLVRWGFRHFANSRLAVAAGLMITLAGAAYFLGGAGSSSPSSVGNASLGLSVPFTFNGHGTSSVNESIPASAAMVIPAELRTLPTPVNSKSTLSNSLATGQSLHVTLELPATTPVELVNSLQGAGFTLVSPIQAQAVLMGGATGSRHMSYTFEVVPNRP